MTDELDALIDAWAAGDRDPTQLERLQQALRDPDNRRRWLDRCVEERALRGSALAVALPATALPRPRSRNRVMLLAALLLLGCGLAWWQPWSTVSSPIQLRVVSGAVTLGDPAERRQPPSDSSVAIGSRLHLAADATIELHRTDGVTATCRGPADLRIAQADQWFLTSGSLTVTVPPATPPTTFQVATPHASAEILGTRFSLRVDADGSELTVERGTVRWHPEGGTAQQVSAGNSALAGHAELWRWQWQPDDNRLSGQLPDCWRLPTPPPPPAQLVDEGLQVQPGRWCIFDRDRAALAALAPRLRQAEAITIGTRLRLPTTDAELSGLLITQFYCEPAPDPRLRYLQLRLPVQAPVPTEAWFDLEHTVHRDGRSELRIDGRIVQQRSATWQVDAWTDDLGLLLMESSDRLLDHPSLTVQAIWLQVH